MDQPGDADDRQERLSTLSSGPLHRFADWPNTEVPNWRAGVYAIWEDASLIYVGMTGRGLVLDDHETAAARASTKSHGLPDRLRSHASGRRSGDQFNIYVCDRLVIPTLTGEEINDIATGTLSLDAKTRAYIHDNLGYRFAVTDDATSAFELERQVQRGAINGQRLLLNPL